MKAKIAKAYDQKFEFLFTQLNVGNTADAVAKHVHPPKLRRPMPVNGQPMVAAAPDDADLSD